MPEYISRREFVLGSGAAIAAASSVDSEPARGGTTPWHLSIQRCGQTNLNEKDLLNLDVEGWADYWASLRTDAVVINAGGIVAYYPTRIRYHHHSKFLTDRDVFGNFVAALKKRGIRVVARLDPNFAYEDALKAHPEWFQRTIDGQPLNDPESTWLFRTCMFSTYFTDQLPAIIREVNSLYDVDGFFTNGWPTTSSPRLCYCDNCRRMYREKVGGVPQKTVPSDLAYRKFFEAHMERVLEIWRLWDNTAKEKKWDSVFYGNLHTNLRAVKNLKELATVAGWFNVDGQDRGGDADPLWFCSQQCRASKSVMKDRMVTNVCGAYASTDYMAWRHTSKSPEEAILWLAQTVAAGAAPTYHWLGGSPVDNRWRETGRNFYRWMARHSQHFRNTRSLSDVAVVYSQRTLTRYGLEGPRAFQSRSDATDYFQGLYYALLEARVLFDFVHEDDLAPETLKKYRAIILPNVALLSDRQCEQLRNYAQAGGSLLATYETSLYNEWGDRRSELGIADVFGVKLAGETQGPLTNSYAKVEDRRHPILNGIGRTELLPGAVFRVPVRVVRPGSQPLTYVPPYPSHPPEMVYPREAPAGEPAIVLKEQGNAKLVYFPGDVDRTCWRTSNTDLDLLLQNAIRWMYGESAIREPAPVSVDGEGTLEVFAWETEPGYAVHLINYTNPHMLAGWVRRFCSVGRQQVTIRIPEHVDISSVQALRAERNLPFRREGELVRFEVPRVVDYEVAAVVRG